MRFLLLFLLFTTIQGSAQLIIRNTNIIDVENKKILLPQDVLIENGSISAIGKNLKTTATHVIDGTGKYLLPGLVDAHVHFFQSGGLYTRPDAIDLRQSRPYKDEIEWVHNNMENFLRRYLSAGITSVIDVGSNVHFLQQRDSFLTKSYAPSIYMTGPLLTTWQPNVFRNLGDEEPFNEMKSITDARDYVNMQLQHKPDFIKIWYIALGKNVDSSARANLPMVKAVIEESHSKGLRVAVHATERITATLAVEAGADYLVHSVDDQPVDDAFIKLLKAKKTVLCPTLIVSSGYSKTLGQTHSFASYDFKYAHPKQLNSILDMKVLDTAITNRYLNYFSDKSNIARERTQDSIMRTNLKKLVDGGVIIATGTDAGNIGTQHVSSYFDELKAMKESGMDMWQIIQASTINGSIAVGKEEEFGSIKKGRRADLLLLNNNPVERLENLQTIDWVINKGNPIKPDSVIRSTPEDLADQQLAAYNAHDLEGFLAPYAEDVEIYTFPDKISIKGKADMRKKYQFLKTTPKLYCRLLNRIVQGNIVIDHEEVWGKGDKPFYGIAIYEIKDNKISKVYFPE